MIVKRKKASEIYKRQNTLIHKAFAANCMPYHEQKDLWLVRVFNLTGRKVTGISELTLAERHDLIVSFQRQGQRIFSPSVPVKIRGWKKGDPDVEYEFRQDDDPQIRMIYAMWAEMGYRPKILRGLCFKLFGRDDPRWLENRQLDRLVNVVKAKARSKGLGNYYKRGLSQSPQRSRR